MAATEVRRSLTADGDLRSEVDFQNDVNALLARVEQWQMPWRSLSDLSPAPLASAITADATPLPVRVGPSIGRLVPIVVDTPPTLRRARS
jgi:hypothetical protein